jgi:UDP-N-acetylglucosamine 2-epimerase (non-hydrolysing)
MKKPKIVIVLGTRPEIIKLSPIILEMKKRRMNYILLHTGQHYSRRMDTVFFKDLKIPEPKLFLGVGSGSQATQTGRVLICVEKALVDLQPDIVIVEGDTNSVLATALAAVKLNIKIAHVEAGLRSFYREMPEEINRILTDHMSEYLFAPTTISQDNLVREGISKKKIFVTGNTIVDAIEKNLKIAEKRSKILSDLLLTDHTYFVLTLHRKESVDRKEILKEIVAGIRELCRTHHIVFPIHPRTKKRLHEFNLTQSVKRVKNLTLIEPLGYLDFLKLIKNARLMLTDSGGIQEETCILRVPCVTLRENTERPESVSVGANIIAGRKSVSMIKCVYTMLKKKRTWRNPYGSGKSAQKIVEIITQS